jgi:hypothetical protein
MATIFPAQIDTSINLPTARDNITPVTGLAVNILRDAIIAIEQTLGIRPQGIYTTVRARLDTLESVIFNTNGAGSVIVDGIPLPGQTIIWNGTSWAPTVNGTNNFGTQSISTTGGIVSGPIDSASEATGLLEVDGKIIVDGVDAPLTSVSNPGQGIIYFDGYSNQFLVSQDGYAYTPLIGSNFITGGDLSGTSTNQTVIGLQTIPVSSTTPTTNQVLTFIGGQWTPHSPTSTPTGSAGGDLSGTYPNPTVARINGAFIPPAGSLIDGYVLQVFGSSFLNYAPINLAGGSNYVDGLLPAANQAPQTLLGDVTGTATASHVVKINGASAPVAGSLTLGNVLQVSGSSSLSYGLVDLTLSVTGVLSDANQAPQPMSGDITGFTNASVISMLQGITVSVGSPSAGEVLGFNGSEWVPVSTSFTTVPTGPAGGDLDGYYPNPGVVALRSIPIAAGVPTTGQYFVYDGYEWAGTTVTPVFTAGGDLTGTDTNQSVVKIQGNAISPASPGDGDFLVWNAGFNDWEPTHVFIPSTLPPSGPASGDLGNNYPGPIVIAIQGNPINDAGPVVDQFLGWDGSTWGPMYLTGAPPIGGAGGDLSNTYPNPTVAKINGNAIKSQVLNSGYDGYVLTWVNFTNEWEAKPTPAALPPSGSAGGDLSGTYPNPTVKAIQGNAIANTVLGSIQDGYVLTWINADNQWEAKRVENDGVIQNVIIITGDYSIELTDTVISVGSISGTVNVTLPNNPTVGQTFVIKDGRGNAATHNITINGNGNMIDGASTYIIAVNYESVTAVWDSGMWISM